MSLNRKMSDLHEGYLQQALGGRRTPGSGNQPANPMDGRHNRYEETMAFAWDGKSTFAKSISVSLAMWEKAREQSLGERPMLALRFYSDDRLKNVKHDLVVIDMEDFLELLEIANARD